LVTEAFQSFNKIVLHSDAVKLTVTVFILIINLSFQIFWPKWLNFFLSFQKHFGQQLSWI